MESLDKIRERDIGWEKKNGELKMIDIETNKQTFMYTIVSVCRSYCQATLVPQQV